METHHFCRVSGRLVFGRFVDLRGNLGIVTDLFLPWKETPSSTPLPSIFCLAAFSEVKGISFIFSREINIETGESILEKV